MLVTRATGPWNIQNATYPTSTLAPPPRNTKHDVSLNWHIKFFVADGATESSSLWRKIAITRALYPVQVRVRWYINKQKSSLKTKSLCINDTYYERINSSRWIMKIVPIERERKARPYHNTKQQYISMLSYTVYVTNYIVVWNVWLSWRYDSYAESPRLVVPWNWTKSAQTVTLHRLWGESRMFSL